MAPKTLPNNKPLRFLLRCAALLAILLPATLWGQITPTTDANGNGTIEDSEKVLYLIQTNQFQSFYMVPASDGTHVSTNNIPNAQMLWYFLDAEYDTVNDIRYYYIVSNTNNKCIWRSDGTANNTTSREVKLVDKNASNEERCKFKLVLDNSYGTVGFYNIDVKGSPTYYGLNKQNGSVNNSNPIRLTNTQFIHDYSSKWKFIPYTGSFTWPDPPFTPSTTGQNYYFKIHNIVNTSYNVSSDASSPKKVTISSTASNKMAWYFIEVDDSDPWIKYYYIVNPEAGEYMYYQGTATNGSDQSNAIILKEKTSENEDRFQFIIVQTARTVNDIPVECYTIIPKSLKDQYWASNCISPTSIVDGNPLGIRKGRGTANNNSHWEFDPTVFVAVEAPTVTNNFDGTITLNTATDGATIYYTTNGDTPDNTSTAYSSAFSLGDATVIKAIAYLGSQFSDVTTYNVPQYDAPTITFNSATLQVTISGLTGATLYYTTNGSTPTASNYTGTGTTTVTINGVSSATTVKAIATHAGYLASTVVELTITQVATPTIQNNGNNAISITCATEGATIYYTTNGSTPTSSSTQYTGPLTENVSGVTIKAIAVKENMINSAVGSGSVTLQCAAPVIVRNGNSGFIATCAFPASDVTIYYTTGDGTQADPTTSSSSIASGGSVSIELPTTVKAMAVAANYNNSNVTTTAVNQAMAGSGSAEDPYIIESQADVADFIIKANTAAEASKHYKVTATSPLDFSGVSSITEPFSGSFDGNLQTLTGLTHALFDIVNGGVVKNVMLQGVNISSDADTVGAITNIAKGYSRIYNCGILPTSADFPSGTHPYVTTSGNCAGGLVGRLQGDSRVVNCFSYADVSATNLASGLVGDNTFASNAAESGGKYANLRTMVVNCMFYGNITGGAKQYPVYGGEKITNTGATAINNYNFYSVGCTFTSFTTYNCSWPAQIEYLTHYEFHRNLLNSNRELCGWWVGAPNAPSTMSTTDVQAVPKDASLMAKWVLDPSIAPYPILKPFGKYSSPVNIDADASWRETANEWEGKKLGTLSVTINPGSHAASGITTTSPTDFVITDMDTIHGDHCYRKIQLPYYNTVFGDPEGATWSAKYGGNYGDYVVVGWKVSTSEGTTGELVENWQNGYNFADRNCTAKDANRVFAQGGYYYVPEGVTSITITAQWAHAVYFDNTDHSYDRVYMSGSKPGTPFAPAGTRPTTLGNGKTVLTKNVRELATTDAYIGDNVYEYAVVLVGNHQYRHNTGSAGENIGNTNSTKGFTVMSSDFDFDEEPDHCLIWQLGYRYDRQSFCPIRFDFLPIVEIGLAMKEDGSTQYYSLGCYRPLGHFEVTETSLIRFGQFEFSNKSRTVYAPLILNGGIYEQYTKGHQLYAFTTADDKIDYIIIGGNVYMPSFTPGAHVNDNAAFPTRHCAVNIIGGRIDNVYLTGNYNDGVTPNNDNPHCYIDGGKFKQVAAAAKEGINGDVYFKINHSKIWEFYGGSTLADKRVTGSIDVTIDSSIVVKYCGGPKFGDMYYNNNKTITTHATGTTFTFYYGGGNGGTSYVQYEKTDVTKALGSGYDWNGTGNNQGHISNYTAGGYRSDANNYMANYDMEIVNVSTGTEAGQAVFRTYFYAAQFSATNTGPISNTLTGCKVLKNFYGAGNLGGVYGDVISELTDTEVDSLAFGAGFSAKIPQVTIYNSDKTPPTIDINTGIITPQSGGTSTTYTWCYENPETHVVVPDGVNIPDNVNTTNPAFDNTSDGKKYFYTTVSLENLGTVRGDVTLTLKGNSKVGTEGHADTGNVFGGGDESAVAKNASNQKGNTSVNLQQGTTVLGSVYGGGNRGPVGGHSEVKIQ